VCDPLPLSLLLLSTLIFMIAVGFVSMLPNLFRTKGFCFCRLCDHVLIDRFSIQEKISSREKRKEIKSTNFFKKGNKIYLLLCHVKNIKIWSTVNTTQKENLYRNLKSLQKYYNKSLHHWPSIRFYLAHKQSRTLPKHQERELREVQMAPTFYYYTTEYLHNRITFTIYFEMTVDAIL
jgi:hypothetical protein